MTNETLNKAREIVAGFLKARRIELGLTQQQLADKSGLGLRTIVRFEAGQFWLVMKQYFILCEALGLVPAIGKIEDNEPIVNAIREGWKNEPPAMSLKDALKAKADRNKRPDEHN